MDREALQSQLDYLTKERNCISAGLTAKYQVIERERQRLDYIDKRIAEILGTLKRMNNIRVVK